MLQGPYEQCCGYEANPFQMQFSTLSFQLSNFFFQKWSTILASSQSHIAINP
jgi:hypothetical protein